MRKIFCDSCGEHITGGKLACEMAGRISTDSGTLAVHVSVEYEQTNDICKYCVIDAINKLDDRAKPALPGGAA